MNKEAILQRISKLTYPENWHENAEVLAEVQKLGKTVWNDEPKRGRKSRKIAILHSGKILVTGTARELSEITNLSKNAIRNKASSGDVDEKDRKFVYLEEV